MKILNLYAGIGGNRKLWGDEHEITAVEYDEKIAQIYKDNFSNDNVIVTDAHEYLRLNYQDYDLIWTSPPCPTHSRIRQNVGVLALGYEALFPDLKLYQEIIFLKHHMEIKKHNIKKLWIVENVIPYYEPLIPGNKIGRHLFWSNFDIQDIKLPHIPMKESSPKDWEKFLGFDLSSYKGINKRTLLRNCVIPKLGKHILDEAINDISGHRVQETSKS